MSAIVSPALSWASRVLAPRCGVTTTESMPNSGDSVVGSVAKTSRAAPATVPVADRLGERRLVDDPAAGDVDDAQARLGLEQQVATDQPGRLGGLRQVDREEVGLGDDLVEGHQLDAAQAGAVGGHERVDRRRGACRSRGPGRRRACRCGRGRRCRASCRRARRPPTCCAPTGRRRARRGPAGRCGPGRAAAPSCARRPRRRWTAAR